MEKTKKNKQKDKERKRGKLFIKMESLNYRQSGGVEYRGKYMTFEEVGYWIRRRELADLLRRSEKEEKEESC